MLAALAGRALAAVLRALPELAPGTRSLARRYRRIALPQVWLAWPCSRHSRAAFAAAAGLPGWAVLGRWRFASAVTGGSLLAANASSPWLVIGRRRFMLPRSP